MGWTPRGAWPAIRERVNATNRMYGEMLLPRDRARQRGEDAPRNSVDGRVRVAQRLLDTLAAELRGLTALTRQSTLLSSGTPMALSNELRRSAAARDYRCGSA